MGFRGAAQGFRGTAPRGFEARRHGVSRGGATALIALTALIWRRPSRSRLITRDLIINLMTVAWQADKVSLTCTKME